MYDLVIRGGTTVTVGTMAVADIGIQDGRIAQIGGVMDGTREINARGHYVFPGGVDVHVHLTSPRDPKPGVEVWVDDFYSGSQAAIGGGVTTIGNMTFQRRGETLRDALERDMAAAQRDAAIDYIMHPILTEPSEASLGQIPGLAADGHTSLKIFLVDESFDARVDDYIRAFELAGRSGSLTMVHCEDGALIRCICRALLAEGRGAPRNWPDARPDYTEAVATERAIAISRATKAPIYIVHLSSAAALAAARKARAQGAKVYVETRPLYLYMSREAFEQADAAKYVGAPPLREPADLRAMWNGIHAANIQCICTDHAPWTLRQKLDPTLDITNVRQGVSDLETLMPMLFSEGVRTGRISLSRFVEMTSTNAAKLFGMYPQKGTIAVGSDADLVIWDVEASRVIDGAGMHSQSGYSVYDGRTVTGWPLFTLSRGEIVYQEGHVTAERGRGRWIRRARTTGL
ncbi:MAG: dihydropyrimidinase [Chloroflexi bacterium]|nr:dihydropyrimidinase [Chloroflexota bacterium]